MGVNDTANVGAPFVDLSVNGKFVRHLIAVAKKWASAIEIDASDRVKGRVTYSLFVLAATAYPHFVPIRNARADVP
jgi:hypothetical protein